jgi:hypothetical protein
MEEGIGLRGNKLCEGIRGLGRILREFRQQIRWTQEKRGKTQLHEYSTYFATDGRKAITMFGTPSSSGMQVMGFRGHMRPFSWNRNNTIIFEIKLMRNGQGIICPIVQIQDLTQDGHYHFLFLNPPGEEIKVIQDLDAGGVEIQALLGSVLQAIEEEERRSGDKDRSKKGDGRIGLRRTRDWLRRNQMDRRVMDSRKRRRKGEGIQRNGIVQKRGLEIQGR